MRLLSVTLAIVLIGAALAFGQSAVVEEEVGGGGLKAKSPSSARLYSILMPGAGQLYNGETRKGLLQMGAAVVGVALFIIYLPSSEFVRDDYYWASYGYWTDEGSAVLSYGGLAVALGASVWSIIDAPKGARRYNERHGLASLNIGNQTLCVNFDNVTPLGGMSPGLKLSLVL